MAGDQYPYYTYIYIQMGKVPLNGHNDTKL